MMLTETESWNIGKASGKWIMNGSEAASEVSVVQA